MGAFARLREIWEVTSRPNQLMLVTVALAVVLAGVGFIYWAGTPDYQTLVANPAPADSAAIIAKLRNDKIPYRIQEGSIQVPAAQREELRMSMEVLGLMNSGSPGYSALEKAPFGQTQAMEQQTIKRALEGEMENSIRSLSQVASAQVKFAPGDDSMFVSADRREPSASILVHLKPGQELNKANRKAIVNMIARAYTGLTTKNVTMLDGEGNLLWDGVQEVSDTVGIDERQAQEKAYKESLGREIQQQLKAVVGPNKSWVIVRAELDFDKKTETKTEVLPGTATSQTTEEETLKGAGQVATRQPPAGVGGNLGGAPAGGPATPPTYPAASVNGNSGTYSHTTSVKSTAVGSSKTDTIKAPGEVKSLRVSVLLDKSVPADTVAALEQNVKTSVGADPANPQARQVSVQQVEFDKTAIDAEKKSADSSASAERMNRLMGYGIPLALMLIMLIVLARGLKKIVPQVQLALPGGGAQLLGLASAPASGGLNLTVGDLPSGATVVRPDEGLEEAVIGIGGGDQVHTFEVINQNFDADLASVMHMAKSKPETVAALIKSWMAEKPK